METCFYTPCPQVIVGCKLYQTNAATSFVANGYYSDGNNCYNVVSGTVSTITTCPITGGTPYCYRTEIYPTASYQSSCLGETFTVSPLVFKVTLYDINGNQFVANTNYNFDVEFDTQICGSSDSTRILNLTVNQGQTSGGVGFIESQLVECGFGCVTESFMNPRLVNTSLFECIQCGSYTVSTTASSGQLYEYIDCYGMSQTVSIGGVNGYDANTFCAQLNSIITTSNELNVSYNSSCNE